MTALQADKAAALEQLEGELSVLKAQEVEMGTAINSAKQQVTAEGLHVTEAFVSPPAFTRLLSVAA